MPRPIPALLFDARRALHVPSQGGMGELLGSSIRSGQRWERGESVPSPDQLGRLATLVHPKNEALAAEIAACAGTTLERLGLARPPAPSTPDPMYIVDTVVCAAAEAIQLMPDAVRPALRAAFRRARLAGLSVEAVDAALAGGGAGTGGTDAEADERGRKKAR